QSIVPRSRRVRLQGTELEADGRLREIDEGHVGWPARILQHETDHPPEPCATTSWCPGPSWRRGTPPTMRRCLRRCGDWASTARSPGWARAKWSWGESARAVGAEAVSAPAGQRDSLTLFTDI